MTIQERLIELRALSKKMADLLEGTPNTTAIPYNWWQEFYMIRQRMMELLK